MCNLWRNDEANLIRPSPQEWKEFIVSLGGFSNPGLNVIFGGGEPLLFPDILTELIAFCRQNGLRTSLATSGYFVDEKMAKRLAASDLDYIALTLYSLEKETHNFLRGMPDSSERLLKAIAYLSNFHGQLEIAIDTVIMAPNLTELLELTNWVRSDDRIHSIFFQAVMQPFHSRPVEEWYKTEEYNFLWPKDIKEVDFLIDELIKLKGDSLQGKRDKINNPISQLMLFKSYFRNPREFVKKFSCNVTNGDAFTVSPDGSVNLCPYMKPIGNIRNNDIRDIWYSEEAQQRREELALCKKNCHHIVNCWYEEEAGG
jgi:radical SAM protein with 4Fe4S-binding SPASM domain